MILFFFSIINDFTKLYDFLIFYWFDTNYFEAEDIRNYFTLKKDNIYGIHIDDNNVILSGYNCLTLEKDNIYGIHIDYNNVILSGYNCLTLEKDNIYGIHIDYNNGILPGYNCRINTR